MVFVGLNYRVGPYGFLAGEKVRDDGDLNAGLLDQRQALKWVQNHITKVSCAHRVGILLSLVIYFLVRRRSRTCRARRG